MDKPVKGCSHPIRPVLALIEAAGGELRIEEKFRNAVLSKEPNGLVCQEIHLSGYSLGAEPEIRRHSGRKIVGPAVGTYLQYLPGLQKAYCPVILLPYAFGSTDSPFLREAKGTFTDVSLEMNQAVIVQHNPDG